MTTTRHIIDITANLVPGFEAEETSEAKNTAYGILERTYVPDSGDAITAADRVVEALIKAGWRPTVEEPAAEHHGEPNADGPTDAEVAAGTRALMDALDAEGAETARPEDWTTAVRAALVAAREMTRYE